LFETDSEFQFLDKVVHISRVAKVVKGGRRFSFNAFSGCRGWTGTGRRGFGKSQRGTEAIRKPWIEQKKPHKNSYYQLYVPYTVLGTFGSGKYAEASVRRNRVIAGVLFGRGGSSRHSEYLD